MLSWIWDLYTWNEQLKELVFLSGEYASAAVACTKGSVYKERPGCDSLSGVSVVIKTWEGLGEETVAKFVKEGGLEMVSALLIAWSG